MDVPDGSSGPTQRVSSRPRERSFARIQLVVIAGADQGREVSADGSELSIGTEPSNELTLADPAVSRHHVVIALSRRGALLRDLGSTNGTRVDGVEVVEAYLRPGARITLGATTIEVREQGVMSEPLSDATSFATVLGESSAMRRLFEKLPRVAASDVTALLTGETGCGKSLIARELHRASARRDGPFVVIDCGAIPPSLIESELFGHVKGSFTGAHRDRPGAFRAAAGGTLLLEEVGELPIELQPKLLRALEERLVTPVGDDRSHPLDIRVLAATHRDLRERVNTGQFRSDLYFRLHVVSLRVPSLRERRADIRMLANRFHADLTGQLLPEAVAAAFEQRDWPGNVRELRAAVERMVVLGEPDEADAADDGIGAADARSGSSDGSPAIELDGSFREVKERATAAWEARYLEALIARHQGNVSSASRAARMDRNHLRDLLKRYGISTSR